MDHLDYLPLTYILKMASELPLILYTADYRYGVIPKSYNTVLNNCNYRTDIRPMPMPTVDTGTRRRLFAGFRPLSGLGLGRMRSTQNRSISLPESKSFFPSFLSLLPLYHSADMSPSCYQFYPLVRRRRRSFTRCSRVTTPS